ncbi:MAG: hypothetical protein LAO55_17140 [Acidobacteriia bacterium]|nr:hypothetical protein [Terriglobia bacterium]
MSKSITLASAVLLNETMRSTVILAIGFAGMLAAQVPDFTPPTPLLGAVMHNNTRKRSGGTAKNSF